MRPNSCEFGDWTAEFSRTAAIGTRIVAFASRRKLLKCQALVNIPSGWQENGKDFLTCTRR
jgi:hypothetical protein